MSASTPPTLLHASLALDDVWTDPEAFRPTTDMYATSVSAASVHTTASSPSLHAMSDDHHDNHDHDNHNHDDDHEPAAASIELRRQRNRDSMRRTRLRARETLTALRATLARLEAQYATLLVAPHAMDALFVERLHARMLALVQMRRTLESENGAVQAQIAQRQALETELQQILHENALDDMVNEKLSLLGGPAAAAARDQYTPLTPMEAQEIVGTFCHDLARVQSVATHETTGIVEPEIEVFGWCTKRHVDCATNEMHFEFTKRFDHVTAADMLQRAWRQAMDLASYRAAERELDMRRLDFLQHVSPDCKVIVREIVHPVDPIVFRTHYVCFRMPHPRGGDGFLIGMRSVNPPPPAPADHQSPDDATTTKDKKERVVWIDISVSVELLA